MSRTLSDYQPQSETCEHSSHPQPSSRGREGTATAELQYHGICGGFVQPPNSSATVFAVVSQPPNSSTAVFAVWLRRSRSAVHGVCGGHGNVNSSAKLLLRFDENPVGSRTRQFRYKHVAQLNEIYPAHGNVDSSVLSYDSMEAGRTLHAPALPPPPKTTRGSSITNRIWRTLHMPAPSSAESREMVVDYEQNSEDAPRISAAARRKPREDRRLRAELQDAPRASAAARRKPREGGPRSSIIA